MSVGTTPDNAQSKIRIGAEATSCLPADTGAFDYMPEFTTSDIDAEQTVVENPNIRASGHAAEPISGKANVTGTLVSTNDAHGMLPIVASALRKRSAVTDLGNGAKRFTLGRGEATATPSISLEQDRDDGVRDLNVGGRTQSFTTTIANNAAMSTSAVVDFAYQTIWETATEHHPNPATGSLYLRGYPEEWLDRPDGAAGDISLQLVDLFTGSDNVERAVFLASAGQTTVLTGTWTVTASQSSFTGSGGAAESEIVSGDIIDVEGQLLEVDTVTDDDTFTTTTTHTAGATGATLVREYGTANAAAITFSTTRPGASTQSGLPRWDTLFNSSGGRMGNTATSGDRVEAQLDSTTGIVAGTAANLTGTVSVAAADATITGSGTAFLSELRVGDFVTTPGDTTGKRILSIGSDTTAEADSNYDAVESGVTMNRRPIPEVTLTGTVTTAAASSALTGSGTLFTTELAVGSWVRTAGGVVRRIAAITDNTNATVHYDYTGIESGVAATTAYEWTVGRERPTWSATTHASGPFPELLSEVKFFLSATNLPEETEELAESVEFTFEAGRAGRSGIGSKWGAGSFNSGSSTGTVTLTGIKINANKRKAILTSQDVRIRVVASTGKKISTSDFEYEWHFIAHLKPSGKPTVIPDATSNQDIITGPLFDDDADPDGWTDALTLVVTSDEDPPFPTS